MIVFEPDETGRTLPDDGGARLGALPGWSLADLYDGPDSAALKRDIDDAGRRAAGFHDAYKGQVAALDGEVLGAAVAEYEAIDEILGRIMSYAYLLYAGDMSDPAHGRFLQAMQEKATTISSHLIFFTLEINRLSEEALEEKLAAPALAHYRPWLRDVRVFREHQLSDELEQLLHEKQVVGRSAWVRLFDESIAALRFPIAGREMGSAEALNCLSDGDPALRKDAAGVIGRVFADNVRLFAHITNTLAKDKQIEDQWRRYPQPWSSRNLSNHVEDAVVEALVSAVRNAFPQLSHKYYALKAKWFGGDHLDYWDRNAPLPDAEERMIGWDEARGLVLDAYGEFSPTMAEIAGRFFDGRWIDAPVRPGKAPGAFSHPTVPSAHPYILLNYLGKPRDVMTLAHELGHGVHQVLAAEQGHLMSDTPLTLAETASVFGEMLTFRRLMAAESDPRRRRAMLAQKVEDMLNTVVRQTAFFEFERRLHSERREGELSVERLGEIWLDVQRESLGPALRFDQAYGVWWSYIPHFIHAPFYVYAYAFGDCLVNSLYAVYEQNPDGFAETYLAMLRAGGTLRHRDLLAPFGLDASDPGFWDRGLAVIAGLVDELENLG
ncbi:MAG: M3 family oligoendopeptidase [Alphaproteobacteria bacterium]|nr:M3 family oligoendopeptidase [Alphaproteobacteria bacterium]